MILQDNSKESIKADLLRGRIPILTRLTWPSEPVRDALMPWFRKHRSIIESCFDDEPIVNRLMEMIENIENCYQGKKINIDKKSSSDSNTNTLRRYSNQTWWESWKLLFEPPVKKTTTQKLISLRKAAKDCVDNKGTEVVNQIKEEKIITELLVDLGFPATGWGLEAGSGMENILEEIQRMARELRDNEELNDIIDQLGRLENTCKQELNTDIAQAFERVFAERLVEFKSKVADIPNETRGIKLSGEIDRMLPSEAGLLGNPQLKDLWYAKFAEKQLITYRLEGITTTTKLQTMEDEIPTSQGSEKGPILALIDTSGSMSGEPIHRAKAVVLRMCQVAFRDKRELLLSEFGSVGEIEECRLEMNPNGLKRLLKFLEGGFGGGTDINGPIKKALPYLQQETWQSADIVIVSDGQFYVENDTNNGTLKQLNEARQKHNVRVTGILIGNYGESFKKLTDTGRLYQLRNRGDIYQY
ncbi:MAG: VWA domain-containing protein [Crocosphaera sp.]|uniref:VWA domain-containing protein n=1 Tax=Crocosphaera sp. TaxID=2729996 RepID=UPI00258EBD0F|nr:VWA domain-containing protein [Crocosphaera sp.]MCH2232452.1 VWA domain-containing protein [Crocinitomicaceae bacterium]MCH2245391.1 VWA domain-containing protein [Crocosphaera sp.]